MTDFDNISDTDSSYDIMDELPDPATLNFDDDDGAIEDDGIPALLEQFCRYPDADLVLVNLIVSGFPHPFINRVYAILKNYTRICNWMLKSTKYSYSNCKPLDDPLNNFTTFYKGEEHLPLQRGIWRWLTFTKENKLELVLAVPPRHWAFGKSAEELPIPECVETLTSDQFHEKYHDYASLHTPVANYWWFIVIHPFMTQNGTSYNTIPDILAAAQTTNLDISLIKRKDVMTISRLKDIITIYCDMLNEYHQDAVGHKFMDRLPRRPNKRTRDRCKRKLMKHNYTLV